MTGAVRSALVHQAFLYGSPDEFVASMAPFVREGLERGDTIFGATKPANIAALRDELGDDAGRVELHDTDEWCNRPYHRLQAVKHLVREVPPGRVLRAMGEPVWTGSMASNRQWARYESIINLALADAPLRFICLYDSSVLPDEILEHALHTHPERVDGSSVHPCPEFLTPDEFLPGLPPTPPDEAPKLPLDGPRFRRLVAAHAIGAGLQSERVDELVLAANEVATNAILYGAAPVSARLWTEEDELICQVADCGPGLADPLAGWLPPPTPDKGGWGLPIARQLADGLDIVRSDSGTLVSLHVSLGRRSGL